MNQFDVLEVTHTGRNQVRSAILAVNKLDLPQEVVQTVIRYSLYWFASYFMCKHHNLIQNVLKLLKGTIFVTHWIKFLCAKQCHCTSFQASCTVHPHKEKPKNLQAVFLKLSMLHIRIHLSLTGHIFLT